MKITRRQLRQIIKEEFSKLLLELPPAIETPGGFIQIPSDVGMTSSMKDSGAELFPDDVEEDEDEEDDIESDTKPGDEAGV